ncbi:ATP-binding cassette domain-containing protein [Telmatospirillum sp. J64-1]|uniref:ATP-binding cassette domain-containing protein n=1 Tax=Telmatospirillum sp. J64-1 TaxID=2502183 RepID=UPI00115F403A|nr:ATP-binding cassette domain-containing protein [Telmatospirillum sp. J64-1]
MRPFIRIRDLHKSFTLHCYGEYQLPVLSGLSLDVGSGECVLLDGPSGSGKSTLLRAVHGQCPPQSGSILVDAPGLGEAVEITEAPPSRLHDLHRDVIGMVSPVLPPTTAICSLNIVCEALPDANVATCRDLAATMLERLNLPEAMWNVPAVSLPPCERQKVAIARCFVRDYPILLLDEPETATDEETRDILGDMIEEAKARGAAILASLRDPFLRRSTATRHQHLEDQSLAWAAQ